MDDTLFDLPAEPASDTASQVIVGVGLTDAGSDQCQLGPMVRQLERRYARVPGAMLVDGGHVPSPRSGRSPRASPS